MSRCPDDNLLGAVHLDAAPEIVRHEAKRNYGKFRENRNAGCPSSRTVRKATRKDKRKRAAYDEMRYRKPRHGGQREKGAASRECPRHSLGCARARVDSTLQFAPAHHRCCA